MLLIYTSKITPRVKYIFKLIFTDILGVQIRFTSDTNDFNSYADAKINYSQNTLQDGLFFQAGNLLFESGIADYKIEVFNHEKNIAFFPTKNNSVLPFDPFAASFYLVSRYEEYLSYVKDKHGRFPAEESLAYKNDFLKKPLINIWAKNIKKIINDKYPDFYFPPGSYQYVSTIDIDNAYAYLGKGLIRTMGAYVRSFFSFNIKEVSGRTNVLIGKKKDPFDTYEYQMKLKKIYNYEAIYFMLFARLSKYDRNLSPQSNKYCSLIKELSEYVQVGIHPSYASHSDTGKLQNEMDSLSGVLNYKITKSRQHFLKLSFPDTYRKLMDIGITDDYSMGYASQLGFRASICTPFYFYDLLSETEFGLKIHPFAFMDSTLIDYLGIQPKDGMKYIQPLIDEVKSVEGTFISIWHNRTFSGIKKWQGWNDVYEEMIENALD